MGVATRLFQLSAASALAALVLGFTKLWLVSGGCFAITIGYIVVQNYTKKPNPPPSPPVPDGKVRICVAGYTHSGPTAKAHYLADLIAQRYPSKYETWYYFDSFAFHSFSVPRFRDVTFPQHLKGHSTSPFVWFETGKNNTEEAIGGSDHFSEWAIKTFPSDSDIVALAKENFMSLKPYINGRSYHCTDGIPVPPATCGSKKSM